MVPLFSLSLPLLPSPLVLSISVSLLVSVIVAYPFYVPSTNASLSPLPSLSISFSLAPSLFLSLSP